MRQIVSTAILLLATSLSAVAADDIVIEAPVQVDQARFSWSGPYVGLSVGYAWLKDVDHAPPPPFVAPLHDKGEDWNVGGHAGFLYQFDNNLVVGGEVEATRLDIKYEGFDFITTEHAITPKARIGYAFDRFLVSGHAGPTYVKTDYLGLADWGINAGVGVDYAFTDNITAGLQYTHHKFTEFDGTKIDAKVDAVSARVGYKF